MPANLTEVVTALTSTTVAAGGIFSFSARASNIGNSTTGGGFSSRIFLSVDPIIDGFDTVLQIQVVPTLAANSEYIQNYVVNLPGNLAPGTYYVGGLADYNNQIGESNESDNNFNRITLTVTPPLLPNLTEVVTALTSTTVPAGTSFSFATNTVNNGQNVASGSTARIYISADPIIDVNDTLLASHVSGSLNPGGGSAQNFAVNLPGNLTPGTYYIGGLADYFNQVGESNESDNNGNYLTINVTAAPPPPAPDLRAVVTALTGTSMSAGGSFSFAVNSVNEGNLAAPGSTTRVFLSTDTTINGLDTVLAIQPVGPLNPGAGQAQNYQVSMPGNLAPGTYYIGGLADYNGQVGESNESNNNGNLLTITILAPDLTETLTALSGTSMTAGGSFSFASRTSNLGQGNSAGSTSGIYLSTDPNITTSDRLLMTRGVGALASGGTNAQNYVINLPSDLATGTYYIGGVADYLGQVIEGNEGNNNNNYIAINVTGPAFSINFSYSGDQQYLQYFTAAAARWSQVITADLPDVNSGQYGFIDDLLIQVNIAPIDGVGGVLGQAGWDARRANNQGGLPYHGTMTFDSADVANLVANGTFQYTVLHEIGHILGIGTLWDTFGLRNGGNYTGPNALAAYRVQSGNPGATSVPLETGGGSGTAFAHWSEAVFGNELMTGFLNNGVNPLSTVTVGTLQDMGYQVNYGAADPYTLPGHIEGAAAVASQEGLGRFVALPMDEANSQLSEAIAGSFAEGMTICRADPNNAICWVDPNASAPPLAPPEQPGKYWPA